MKYFKIEVGVEKIATNEAFGDDWVPSTRQIADEIDKLVGGRESDGHVFRFVRSAEFDL